jgi:hypothetical protein
MFIGVATVYESFTERKDYAPESAFEIMANAL